ncbi:TetR/AcrR family transcriptional regulator [Plantactinospora sp. GCM10030261]|uniref:TetR/AcrR family transcriptional regulator n=1 Tax=Plantactinospora sp. GCM10030261 TaxID=3273420 RepID=UPI003618CD31
MPRVSAQHLEARRRQILAAARTCFLRDGFHNTSMQDVITEAGLSVGAVYRYFRSKNELITSIAEEAVGGAGTLFDDLAGRRPPPTLNEALTETWKFVDAQTGPDGATRIAIQVWGEALRDPELGKFVARMYSEFRARFVTLAQLAQRNGELPPDADPEAVGAALYALVPGYVLQRVLTGSPDSATFLAGVRTLLGLREPGPDRSATA